MSPVRILTIVGARPQFIKAAAVSRAICETDGIEEVMVHTGQHFDADMSDVFFDELGIPAPAHRLDVHGGNHGDMTGRMMIGLEPIVAADKPDWVMVYGDTNSTLAGALVAAKLHVPVAHVEAGLRSFNRRMPEEINRVLTDHVATLLLCPTRASVENLAAEGIRDGVHHVGDVMYDATLFAVERARGRSTIRTDLDLEPGTYAVATVHRAENTDDPRRLDAVFAYLRKQAEHTLVVLPMHPRTRQAIQRLGVNLKGIRAVGPVGYLDMVQLVSGSAAVFTDSGGLQKEAYFHRVPCTTLREETEWLETIAHGWNRLWTGPAHSPRSSITDYGEGQAAYRIAELLTGCSAAQ